MKHFEDVSDMTVSVGEDKDDGESKIIKREKGWKGM